MTQPTRLPALTGLRFFLAFSVLLFHAKEWIHQEHIFLFVKKGYLGVDLFFVLSGFILSYVYQESFIAKAFSFGEYLRFIRKRFAKIYPVHFFTFLFVLAVTWLGVRNGSVQVQFCNIWQNLLMVNGWGTYCEGCPTWNFPSWSVSVEWFAYLFCFPLGAFMLRKTSHWWLALAAVVSWLAFLAYVSSFPTTGGSIALPGTRVLILRVIPEFLGGMWMYCIFKYRHDLIRRISLPVNITLMAALITAVLCRFSYLDYFLLPCFLWLIATVGTGAGFFNRFLSTRVMVYGGNISYSMYMVQYPVMLVLGQVFPVIAARLGFPADSASITTLGSCCYLSLLIAGDILAAALCYHLIEEPLRKLISRTRKQAAA